MKRLIPVLLLFLTLASCSRERDNSPPAISFNTPATNQQYNVSDTIRVQLRVTSPNEISYVQIKVTDQTVTPVLPVLVDNPGGTAVTVNFTLPIDNFRLNSGTYYIYAEAGDINGSRRTINIPIYITGLPLDIKGFFAVTQPLSSQVKIYRTDTSWSPMIWQQLSSDFSDMELSSYWQQIYISGSYFGLLRSESIDGLTGNWIQNTISSSSPYWGPLSVHEKKLLVSNRGNSALKTFDYAGNPGISYPINNGYYPEHQIQIANRIFIEKKDISQTQNYFAVFSSSGGGIQESPMNIDLVSLFRKDDDNVYAIGNDATQGHLLIYDVAGNGFWEPIALPAGLVTAAAQIDSTTLLIAMNDGNLYRFTYSPIGILNWASSINASQIRYDAIHDEVYIAESSSVKVYSYNPFVLQHTASFSEPVVDMELWYNR
jgi:hypothetical protein